MRDVKHDGLPQMLGYKIDRDLGEILMTDSGPNLEKWNIKFRTKQEKIDFMIDMLK